MNPVEMDDDAQRAAWGKAYGAACQLQVLRRYAEPIKGSVAERYLRQRGIECETPGEWVCIPHGAELDRIDSFVAKMPRTPAMLVAMRSSLDRRICGYHVTRLRRDGSGKAIRHTQDGEELPARTMHGIAKGAVVEIGSTDGGTLIIAEGIETALSCHQATGCRAWATLSAGNLADITIPADASEVIICGDNDAKGTGQKAARALAERVARMGKVARLAIPAREGEDWNDVARDGMSDREIARALINAQEIKPPKLVMISDTDFAALSLPPRQMLLEPWLPAGGLALVHAWRGTGKTHFGLGVAYAVAHGGEMLDWRAPKRRRVLYVDGELPRELLQPWVQEYRRGYDGVESAGVDLVAYGMQPSGMPDLCTVEGQNLLDELIADDVGLVIIDSITSMCRTGIENDAESWQPVQSWALRHRARGRSIIFLHHDSKEGKQRGTSRREDVLDAVLHLKHPESYTPDMGLYFWVHFQKARHFFGDAAKSFVARAAKDNNGVYWARETAGAIIADPREQALRMIAQDMTHAQVATALNIDRSTVSKWLADARRAADAAANPRRDDAEPSAEITALEPRKRAKRA